MIGILLPVLANDEIFCITIMSESNSATRNRGLYSNTRRNLQLCLHVCLNHDIEAAVS